MATVRARLASAYALALSGTIVVLAATLWAARGAAGDRELQRYVTEEAEVATRLLRQASGPGLPLTEVVDHQPQVVSRVALLLDALPNIVVVLDSAERIVYRSTDARLLDFGQAERIIDASTQLSPTLSGKLDVTRDTSGASGAYLRARGLPQQEEVLVVRRDATRDLAPIRRIVVGTPTRSAIDARRELFTPLLAVMPLVLIASGGFGWWLAGRSVRPLERVIDEMEAITDGRSLHRRLAAGEAAPEDGDELTRLTTTLNAMIGRLESSFGALRRFTADASHELKTPLTVLRATVERAMSAPPQSGEQLVALEEALQEVTRMAALVDSLLTLARFDEGRFDLHREPVALEPLVYDVLETATILGEDAGLTIRLAALEPATVLGDETRLRQLFLNLVTNAIKYTPRGGLVELALRRGAGLVNGADGVQLTVRDTGIGIAAADLPYIFDRFWRADRARSRRTAAGTALGVTERGGFGLGLAISQWIAQAHGGTIAVASRLTRGTTFTVTLPTEPTREISAVEVEVGAAELRSVPA
ncbi:MAG TPA: HAMP domain-containing sensor histidine kinase [Gemmatirosa sp.]